MSKDNLSFYNPTPIGYFDLGTSQINKALSFKSEEGVFIPEAKISFYSRAKGTTPRALFKIYTLGDGLALSGTNTQGSEKTLVLTLNGADFGAATPGDYFDAEATLFSLGDIEITFSLEIK